MGRNISQSFHSHLRVQVIEGRFLINLVDDGGRPQEQDGVDLAVGVDADLQLRRVVGYDLALVGHLLAHQDGPHVRLDQLRVTHVAHAKLKLNLKTIDRLSVSAKWQETDQFVHICVRQWNQIKNDYIA